MAGPKLRAVGAGETSLPALPKSLADATETDRRSFLVRSRLEIARTVDAGVPAHALARLISELDRIDIEIRRLDALAAQIVQESHANADDDSFDASAI